MPPFLDTTEPHPIVAPSTHPLEPPPPQNIQHTSLGGALVQNLQSILGNFMFDPSMDDLTLSELLVRMRITSVPARCNGVVYSGFPPEGFHEARTASWFSCPFFLQAANNGIPVINLHSTSFLSKI